MAHVGPTARCVFPPRSGLYRHGIERRARFGAAWTDDIRSLTGSAAGRPSLGPSVATAISAHSRLAMSEHSLRSITMLSLQAIVVKVGYSGQGCSGCTLIMWANMSVLPKLSTF